MRYFNGGALYEISYSSAYNALLHVTHFFSNFKYIRKYLQNCVWLSYLFPFQKRVAKTGEFRPSKAGPCLKCFCIQYLCSLVFLCESYWVGQGKKVRNNSSFFKTAQLERFKQKIDFL